MNQQPQHHKIKNIFNYHKMNQGLALHTSSGELGLSIINKDNICRCQSWDLGRDLANNLQEKIGEFLPPILWQDLDFIAVAKGPGSFTSTRIGVVTAKTLAQQLNIPVFGISTLESLAWYHGKNLDNSSILAVEMKANLEEVFGAIYQFINQNTLLLSLRLDRAYKKEEWDIIIKEYQDKKEPNFHHIIAPDKLAFTTESLLEIAMLKINNNQDNSVNNWQNLTPFYN
ncbi:tRNA (adenosine(37)-N6)-threonylcarbamoyltransferase complex dimerization subunit type 1 TsaB [Geminocystis sp. CENA526]|uniref:tRNA (adenosine(37)-N6)-threonylcarbamoyltransferase complex dimerization subunit type 1 TsaB n=1 Tax=Geminocystis sp. CENA526 TaxID=1355871 RepID=UPI003D6E7A00